MKNRFILSTFSLLLLIHWGCNDKTQSINEKDKTKDIVLLNKKTQSNRTKSYSPEEERRSFKVPEGFIVELVASEEDGIINPIDLTFDDAGRLWTQTASMYPLDPIADIPWNKLLELMNDPEAQKNDPAFKRISDLYQGRTKGEDKILVLSDLYGKSKSQVKVWADGLAIPQSILPYKNGSFVAQGSEMFFLEDTNQDGKADTRTPLFTGFGFTDTHTMAHTLLRGPGDWIHFSHGALNKGEVSSFVSDIKTSINYSKIARFSLDAKRMEVVSSGLNNIWGYQLRGNGQWYGCEANDLGYSVVPMEIGTGFPGIGTDRLRDYQPWMPELHEFRVGGTGISGLAFADDTAGSFPAQWKDVAFLANPITSSINAVRIVRNSDGTVSAEHLPDFLTSEDDWFRPVNMEFGPDGSLYVADWYNKIISHNELPTTHPDRDKAHGRIWRIRHKSQRSRTIPNMYEVKTEKLVSHLKSPSLWEKRSAWHQIADRPIKETSKLKQDLIKLLGDESQDEITRIHALWSLEAIGQYDKEVMGQLLKTPQQELKRESVRSLSSFSLSASEISAALKNLIDDPNAMVRSQVLRTLSDIGVADFSTIALLIQACKAELEGNAMGGSYERRFERFLARKALENYPNELLSYLNSPSSQEHPVSNLIWASQALPKVERERLFLDLWRKAKYNELDEATFIIVSQMLSNKEIYNVVKPVLENTANAQQHVALTLKNLGQVQSDALTKLLEKPIRSLLTRTEKAENELGLEAVGKLNITSLREAVIPLIKDSTSEETLVLAMKALESQPKENEAIFTKISGYSTLSIESRGMALGILSKANEVKAYTLFSGVITNLNDVQKEILIKELSKSVGGIALLKRGFKGQLFSVELVDLSSAERIHAADKEDSSGLEIINGVRKRMEEERKGFEAKLQKYLAIAENNSGDAASGEQLFQVCLLCHKVGNKGQSMAPALDGSAMRENEALLTAILDPNAAVESSYAIYRVKKKDGTEMEGYLVKRDNRGTTLGFMGGSEQFIQTSDIQSEGFLTGRSFMPAGLIDSYSDKQVADLLAYIRTLK